MKVIKKCFTALLSLLLIVSLTITAFAVPKTINETVYIDHDTYYIRDSSKNIEYWQHTWNIGNNPHSGGDPMYWMWAYNTQSDMQSDENGWTCYCLDPGLVAALDNGVTLQDYGVAKWDDVPLAKRSLMMGILAYGYEGNSSNVKRVASCSSQEAYMATQLSLWDVAAGYRSVTSSKLTTSTPTIYYANNCSCSSGDLTVSGGKYPGLTKAYNYIWQCLYDNDNVLQSNGNYKIRPSKPTFSYDSESDAKSKKYEATYNSDSRSYTTTLTSTNCVPSNGCLDMYIGGSNPIELDNYEYTRTYQGKTKTSYITTKVDSSNPQKLNVSITGDPINSDEPFTYKIFSNFANTVINGLKNSFVDSTGFVICTAVADTDQFQTVMVAGNAGYVTTRTAYISLYTDLPNGNISIHKSSDIPELTDGNDCYSLKDAVYGIYSDAECKTDPVTTITTDENGEGTSEDIPAGTYYLKEITAPEGYALSPEIKQVTVTSGETVTYDVVEIPQADPVIILLKKINSETGKAEKGLEGAEYTYNYYNSYYDSLDELDGVTPTKSYVFKTDKDGFIFFLNDYLVSGDDFYYMKDNPDPVLPLGTVTVKETKAPEGYYIDTETYLVNIKPEGATTGTIRTYNTPTSSDAPIPKINVSGQKVWSDSNDNDGIRPSSITVYLLRDGKRIDSTVVTEKTNWAFSFNDLYKTDANKKAYVYTIEEDPVPEGYTVAITKSNDKFIVTNTHKPETINLSGQKTWSDFDDCMSYRPESITVNLLANGEIVDSVTAVKDNNWAYEFKNKPKYYDHGKLINYTVQEEPVENYTPSYNGLNIVNEYESGSVTIQKFDEDMKPLSNVIFRIYTESGKAVAVTGTVGTYTFNGLSGKTKLVTNTDGTVTVNKLPVGNYYITETSTKANYIPYEGKISFTIKNDSEEELNPVITVKNNKVLMQNTGSVGNMVFYIIGGSVGLIAIALIIFSIIKSKKGTKNNEKDNN